MRKAFCEALGTQLQLPDKVEKIVSFSPAVTETLFLLGAGDMVVGVSAFCARPLDARKKRVLGSYNTVSKKTLEEVGPDVVFTTTGYQREFALGLSRDFPVYAIELPVSLAGIVDSVLKVGLVTGLVREGSKLSRQLVDSLGQCERVRRQVRVYLEIDFNGPVSFGAYSYITDAVRFLGGDSIYGEQFCEWLAPNLEYVKRSDPDVILYEAKMFSRFGESDLVDLVRGRGWEDLRAVRNGRVFLAPGPLDFFAHHGPTFITEVLPWLRARLEGMGHD
jgi:iron complex transport system substrate-binding protein